MAGKIDLLSKSATELEVILAEFDLPKFRVKQLFSAFHKNLADDFANITTLPAILREELAKKYSIKPIEIEKSKRAKDGTEKYLLKLFDNNFVEAVYIPSSSRNTLCVSTMVGCPFGCTFCESGKMGFMRNLTVSEIIGQFYRVKKLHEVSNIVFMGIGEPLANYDNLISAVRLMSHVDGQNFSPRRMTVSTVGLVEGIKQLANEKLPLNLAISLHSPFQEERVKIIPSAEKYPISDIMSASHYFINRTGRKVSFEYTVIEGVNDGEQHADELRRITKNSQIMVNIIPLNKGTAEMKKSAIAAKNFANLLFERGIETAVRNSRGNDIFAACGQLSSKQ